MNKITEVFFDIETQKLFGDLPDNDPAGLGVSIVSVYKRELDENLKETAGTMYSFWEKELANMWELFQGANRVIGFNSLGFDVPVLKPYAPAYFARLPHFDILQKFKEIANHRISLNSLAKITLGKNKTDSGLNAVTYWQKGDPKSLAKLKKYCEADVALTKDLYHHALINQELCFLDKWNTVRKISVDFSYPKEKDTINQGSLF